MSEKHTSLLSYLEQDIQELNVLNESLSSLLNDDCQLVERGQTMNQKHTMPSHLAKLEQEVRDLKHIIQTLRWDLDASRELNRQKADRINRLIKLALMTCEPKHRELWEQEEEL